MSLMKTVKAAGIASVLLILPMTSGAAEISWTSQNYTTSANVCIGCSWPLLLQDPVEDSGPPLSISAYAHVQNDPYDSTEGSSYTEISDTSMSISMEASLDSYTYIVRAIGRNTFSGSFTATAPLFLFDYDTNSYGVHMNVLDLTSNETLFDGQILGADTLSIPIPLTNNIEINLTMADSAEFLDYPGSENTTLNYEMSVAPEPISSILFVTGGTLLAGRRYIRRRKTA